MDASRTGMMALLVTIANAAWLYAYTSLGFHFSYIFDFQKELAMLNATTLLTMVAAGLFIALSIAITLYFAAILEKKDAIVGAIVSGILTLAISMFAMKASPIFMFMLFFYIAGLAIVAAITAVKPKGTMDKVKLGWSAGMKITYALAFGAMITGYYFTSINLDDYQSLTKKSLVEFTKSSVNEMNISNMMQNMDLGSSLGDIDLSQIVTKESMEETIRESLTDADVEKLVIAQLGESSYSLLSADQKSQLIASTRDTVVQQAIASYNPSQMQSAMKGVTEKITKQVQQQIMQSEQFKKAQAEITDKMVEQTMDSMPLVKTMLDMLPIMTGFTLLTVVILFGQIIVSPLAAIASLALPTAKEEN